MWAHPSCHACGHSTALPDGTSLYRHCPKCLRDLCTPCEMQHTEDGCERREGDK